MISRWKQHGQSMVAEAMSDLGGLQHVLNDLVHVGCETLRLQVQHLHQASAHCLAYSRVGVMS